MPSFFQRGPSPTMAVAFIALLAALSGTAVALPGTSTVDSGDIQNNAVRSRDLRNNDVRTQDVRDNGLTGTDINESTLGTVPRAAFAQNAANATNATNARNAANATNAAHAATADSAATANSAANADSADTANTASDAATVAGQAVQTFFTEIPNDGPAETLFDIGGLKAVATCGSGNTSVDVESTTGVPATFMAQGFETSGPSTGAFGVELASLIGPSGSGLTPGAPHAGSGSGTATYLLASARMLTVVYGYRADGFGTADACRYWGRVISEG